MKNVFQVRPISGAKSVGIGPSNSSRVNDTERWNEHEVDVQYEEYYVEHDVSTTAARKAAAELNVDESEYYLYIFLVLICNLVFLYSRVNRCRSAGVEYFFYFI